MKRQCTCVRLHGVIFRKTAICNDNCGDKDGDGGGDGGDDAVLI